MQISLSDQIWSGSKDAGCNVISHSDCYFCFLVLDGPLNIGLYFSAVED